MTQTAGGWGPGASLLDAFVPGRSKAPAVSCSRKKDLLGEWGIALSLGGPPKSGCMWELPRCPEKAAEPPGTSVSEQYEK